MIAESERWVPRPRSVVIACVFAIVVSSAGISLAAFGASVSTWTSEDWGFALYGVFSLIEYFALFGVAAGVISAVAVGTILMLVRRLTWPSGLRIAVASGGVFALTSIIQGAGLSWLYELPLPLPGDPVFIFVSTISIQALVSAGVASTLIIDRSIFRKRLRFMSQKLFAADGL